MGDQKQESRFAAIRPYLLIFIAGMLAFAPASFMFNSLKNDIVAIEYPINFYISQCIHNFETPYWFNTWGMGFPLQSNLTWGIYSTPQVFLCTLFDYNIYVLHIEFMFFILLAGTGMFYFLKKHLAINERLALVLAISYMLSGFMVGSSQWLLYITAAAFFPLVAASLLQLLRFPGFFNACRFAVFYFLLFTSVYAAFTIITTYCLIAFIALYFYRRYKKGDNSIGRSFLYTIIAGIITVLLCLPCLYYTVELLPYMERGTAIAKTDFFNSNYLPPASLESMLLPLSSAKMSFPNTEGPMFDCYTGLFVLLFLPMAIRDMFKNKNRIAMIFLGAALLFLILSFGFITPLRSAFNLLPGFSYFRNAGIFRFYFILSLIFFLARVFRDHSWTGLLSSACNQPLPRITFFLLALASFIALLATTGEANSLFSKTPGEIIRQLSYRQSVFLNAGWQLLFLLLLFLLMIKKRFHFAAWVFTGELIINALACMPYFTVSSYSPNALSKIMEVNPGFPVQKERPAEAAAVSTDSRSNTWYNVNVYKKKVSVLPSYRGPLTLKQFEEKPVDTLQRPPFFSQSILLASADSIPETADIRMVLQHPNHIRVHAHLSAPVTLTVLQNYFPGWRAYYNNRSLAFINKDGQGMSVNVPAGSGSLDFVYEKKSVWETALLLHLITLIFFCVAAYRCIANYRNSRHKKRDNE